MGQSERLRKLIKSLSLTQSALADKLGITQGAVSSWLCRDTLSSEGAHRIKEAFPQINLDWLLTGNGQMLISDAPTGAPLIQNQDSTNSGGNSINMGGTQHIGNQVPTNGEQNEPTLAAIMDELRTIMRRLDELNALAERKEKQIDRLLAIIEQISKNQR